MGAWLGDALLFALALTFALGAVYPDGRWPRAVARGWYWDWAVPRWEVRMRLGVFAVLWLALAVFILMVLLKV